MAAAACLALLSCRERADQTQPVNGAVQPPVEPAPLTVAEPPLDRKALLLAAIQAGSDFAAGVDDRAVQRGLDGQRFEMRFRFGCPGRELAEDANFAAEFNADPRRLRLRATPDVEPDDPSLVGIGGEQVEAVEGFWVRRPWLLSTACPAPPHENAARQPARPEEGQVGVSSPARQIAIVQFFTEADPRARRRDRRPYEVTKRLDEGEGPSALGYDLVLSGRLRRLPDGRVIACSGSAGESAPACLISVGIDRVWIERADTRKALVEWAAS